MLDGIHARRQRVADARSPCAWDAACLPHVVRLVHRGAHLLHAELRMLGLHAVGDHAAGRDDLDEVGAHLEVQARGLARLVQPSTSVPMKRLCPPVITMHGPEAIMRGPDDDAGIDRVLEEDADAAAATDVAHRRGAGAQCPLGRRECAGRPS